MQFSIILTPVTYCLIKLFNFIGIIFAGTDSSKQSLIIARKRYVYYNEICCNDYEDSLYNRTSKTENLQVIYRISKFKNYIIN